MKKLLLLIILIQLPCMLSARDDNRVNHRLLIGLNVFYYDYHEKLPGPAKSNEIGWLPGVNIDYTYRTERNGLFARGTIDLASGKTIYDGSLQNTTTWEIYPYTSSTKNLLLNSQWALGYSFNINRGINALGIVPYGGIGFHFWVRDIQGAGGYSEYYFWYYFPVGLMFNYKVGSGWEVGLDATVKFMFLGRIKMNMSEANEEYDDASSNLGNKPGFRLSMPVSYALYKSFRLVCSPWYEYSAIGKGNPVSIYYNGSQWLNVYEPASRTHQFGLIIGVSMGI